MTASDTISTQTGLSCAALLETRLVELSPDTLSFPEAAVFYHLMADGRLQKETSLPVLLPGEGGLLFRHTERIRSIDGTLFVLTCISRPDAISPAFS